MARDIDIFRERPAVAGFPELVRDMTTLSRRLDRMLDDWFSVPGSPFDQDITEGFAPAENIREVEDHYLLSFDIPGVPKDKINIEVRGNVLTVSGEREHRVRGTEQEEHMRFSRSFTLPEDVDPDKIEARCQNGILELAIPKSEAAKPKRIAIGEGGGFFSKLVGQAKETLGAGREEKKRGGTEATKEERAA